MVFRIPKQIKEGRIKIRNAARIALELNRCKSMIVALSNHEMVDGEVDTDRWPEYFYDIDDIEKLYLKMMKTLIREVQDCRLNEDTSLLEYYILEKDSENEFYSKGRWGFCKGLQDKYNSFVPFLKLGMQSEVDDSFVVDPVFRRNKKQHDTIVERLDLLAKEIKCYSQDMNLEYENAIEREIDFWALLDTLETEKWQLTDGDKIEILSGTGELIDTISCSRSI